MLKISIPFFELAKNPTYIKQIEKTLKLNNLTSQSNTTNLTNESPEIELGPDVDDEAYCIPSFHITMCLHGNLIHNCMLDSGASHNLIPKVIMEELGLEVTNTYHELYIFYSKPMKFSK